MKKVIKTCLAMTLLLFITIIVPHFYDAFADEILGSTLQTNGIVISEMESTINKSIQFNATGSGGTEIYYYRYSVIFNNQGKVAQPYSTKSTFDWTPTEPGDYKIMLSVVDSTWSKTVTQTVQISVPELGAALQTDSGATVQPLTTVRMTGAGTGGTGIYYYRYSVISNNQGKVAQPYSTKNTFDWTPTEPGDYKIMLSVVDSTWSKTVTKTIQFSVPELGATLQSDSGGAVQPLTTVKMTGAGSGGTGIYYYRYSVILNNQGKVAQPYSTKSTFDWTPTEPGDYKIMLSVVDSTWGNTVTKTIQFSVPELYATLQSDSGGAVQPLTTVRMTGAGSGGTGIYYYRYSVILNNQGKVAQPYSTKSTFDWTPTEPGDYKIMLSVVDSTWSKTVTKTIQFSVPELSATLAANVNQTIPLANVELSGSASGGTGIYYYRFSVFHNGVGNIVQLYGSSATCNWTPTEVGTYNIVISVVDSRWTTIVSRSVTVQVLPAQIKGIDVSKYQGSVNWQKVHNAGYQFAMIKAGGADDGLYQDSYFEQNYKNAVTNGLTVGTYYYGIATTEDGAIAEARYCLSILKNRPIGLYVAYDVESSVQANAGKDQLTKSIIAFCETIKNAGYKPIVYANPNFFNNYIDVTKLRSIGYDIWVANYQVDAYNSIAFPARIWQSTSSGQVDGIDGNVDIDTLYYYDPTMQVAECTGYSVNVRAAAGTEAPIVASIGHGFVKILGSQMAFSSDIGKQEVWYNIQRNDGITGWVSCRFIQLWDMRV